MKTVGKRTRLKARWALGLVVILSIAAVIAFERDIYNFFAMPTLRVDADILIVEGWGGPGITQTAVDEFHATQYNYIVVAASEVDRGADLIPEESSALQAAEALVKRGIPSEKILVVAPVTDGWNKTAKAAKAACAILKEKGMQPRGLNVITLGLHARRSRLAYQHAIGPGTPVGIITVPSPRFIHRQWWTSRTGLFLVAKNLAGWIRECLFG